jgi:hypothetical protein
MMTKGIQGSVVPWGRMNPTRPATILVAAAVLASSITGAGLVVAEDLPSSTDGNIANGEILTVGADEDDQIYPINYTYRIDNHQPGHTDGGAQHYAIGLPENGTLHRIKLVSDDFGFSNCEPDNAAAFGIDRGNDDPGTNTDKSLLTAFKSYTSEEDFIDIVFYKKEQLAGKPVAGDVTDQIVAAQNNCYDNPSEPGWYRINGTITGNLGGGTETDSKIRDLSNYVYVCDCSSRAEAEETLGPPPSESGGGTGDGGSSAATATPAPDTATATSADTGGSETTATRTATATATDTATATATATDTTPATAAATGTATAQRTDSNQGGGNAATATATATAASGGGGANLNQGAGQQAGGLRTPTAGAGPGFGVLAALLGALLAGLLVRRAD